MDWIGSMGFMALHAACILIFWVGFSWPAVMACIGLYVLRMFGITAGYHRYFSHRSYKTSRVFQFVLAFLGCSSAQMGPLWWAAHHRTHHMYSDKEGDIHSPVLHGLWWSHVGWILSCKYVRTNLETIPDFAKYLELRLLDRFHWIAPVTLGFFLFFFGEYLAAVHPEWGTNGIQMLVWFSLSTVCLYHGTFSINSLAHVLGWRRFALRDSSRNNLMLALITMGEGWHNNHHRYPSAARQGMYWWEIDISYLILRVLSWCRLVWDLRPYPREVYVESR